MPNLIQSFNVESFSLFSRKTAITESSKPGLSLQLLGNSNIGNQCTFSVIQYCIIYVIWRLALLFIPRPEHSRPRPDSPKAKANAKKYGLKAKD